MRFSREEDCTDGSRRKSTAETTRSSRGAMVDSVDGSWMGTVSATYAAHFS